MNFYHQNNKNMRMKLTYTTASKINNIIYLLYSFNHQTLECFGHNFLKPSNSSSLSFLLYI